MVKNLLSTQIYLESQLITEVANLNLNNLELHNSMSLNLREAQRIGRSPIK